MNDKVQKRILELKNNIENVFNLWTKLKVLDIQKIEKEYMIDLIDEEGYKYYVRYSVIKVAERRNSPLHKFFRNNIHTRENIINYLLLHNKNFTLVSEEVINATEDLIWFCPIHGNFNTTWNEVKNDNGCSDCGRIKSAESRRNSFDYVNSKFEENDLVLMTDTYINNEENLPFICNKHKENGIQYISFGNLITGRDCKICSKERVIKNQTKSHEQFLQEVNNIHGDKYIVIGQYVGCKDHIEVYCNKCKESFWIAPSHLLEGHGCSNCNKSLGENEIEQLLLKNKVSFIKQHKFDDCKGIKRKLPFDFATFNNNNLKCLIEYNGIQHYKAVEIFGGQKQLEKQQYYDKIKFDYCKNNNIKLIVIPYWEFKNIESILISEGVI